jgi:hypothetical protein
MLAMFGLVGGAWACGAIAADHGNVPDESDGDGVPTGPHVLPEGGFPFESSLFDGGVDREFPFFDAEFGFDGESFDGESFDGEFADTEFFDGELFDSGTPDAGPPWEGGTPVTFASGEQAPLSLALDDANVYWQNRGGTVLSCPLSGCPGNVPTLLAFNGQLFSEFESTAAARSTVFFLSSLAIDSCAGGGCGLAPSTYWTTPGNDGGGFSDAGIGSLNAVITDTSNVYFADGSMLYSCPIASICDSPTTLFSTLGTIGPLAVTAGEVFFVDRGDSPTGGILAVPIAGGSSRLVCQSSVLVDVRAIVASGAYIYFTTGDDSSSIYQCLAVGGGPTIFASDEFPFGLAADSTSLYWTNAESSGVIGTCPLGAGCVGSRTIASGEDEPLAIAVNATTVYWTTETAIRSAVK